MANIVALVGVIVMVFAAIAMQLFSGMLLKRCVQLDTVSTNGNWT
jgi:hypothetical protein